MSGWTDLAAITQRVARLWDRGDLLRAAWTGAGLEFPYSMPLKGPSSGEWSERFEEARRWIAGLESLPLRWREFSHPRLGRNTVPQAVEWPDLGSLLAFSGHGAETQKFIRLAEAVTARFPALAAWVDRRPHSLLSLEGTERLLDVVQWMLDHPRPGVYLRQVDVPGVHSKFLEDRRGVLSEWFDLVLPSEAVDVSVSASQFARRYGFAEKPVFVRFRPLSHGSGPRDVSWRVEDWDSWADPPGRVVFVENEINYLSLPPTSDTWAVFAAGYGAQAAKAPWLSRTAVWYWGDLDTHGFAILDQFRAHVAHARSFLMDASTLLNHREFWVEEAQPADRDLPRLTTDERDVYRALIENRWGARVRLEQERIRFSEVARAMELISKTR